MNFIEKIAFTAFGILILFFVNTERGSIGYKAATKNVFSPKDIANNQQIYIERPTLVRDLVYREEVILRIKSK